MTASRGICCHVGGQIDFDGAGNLYLSTGDDTNPFQSAGYAPLDDRVNRNPAFDARRTSGNTNDLRGKLLRIKVTRGRQLHHPAGQPVPSGAGAAPGPRSTRWASATRSASRSTASTGDVYVGDYSPDAQMADPARGPEGIGRWMIVRRAANFGWPFCMTHERRVHRLRLHAGHPAVG